VEKQGIGPQVNYSDLTPSQGYSTFDDSSIPEYLVHPSFSLALICPSLMLDPASLDSVVVPKGALRRRLPSSVTDKPTVSLKQGRQVDLVLMPPESATLVY